MLKTSKNKNLNKYINKLKNGGEHMLDESHCILKSYCYCGKL